MKVRQRTICQNCRKWKIACDAKKPSCSQCLLRDASCPGYPSDWIFVPITARDDDGVKPRHAIPRQKRVMAKINCQPTEPHDPPAATPLDDLITVIVRNYVPDRENSAAIGGSESSPRICGAWVEVLPDLIGSDTSAALTSAIKAFAVSIQSRGPKHSVPISAALEAYSSALSSVNDALRVPYDSFPVELGAAVMCLLFADLFLSTSLDSWTAHLQGLGELIQLSRPELYASGITHRLFVGARPALVVLALLSRKSCFLAAEEWRNKPFEEISPSPVQALMSEAAIIPSILERLDRAGSSGDVAAEVLHEFEAVLGRLDAWADSFHSSAPSPIFWLEPSVDAGRQHIWFPSITVANALTHFWAFKVICLGNIRRLKAAGVDSSNGRKAAHCGEIKSLSVMICQSTEYLMQDRMRLFGPTSVMLPLRTAYEAFEVEGYESYEELEWCKRLFADILGRGHRFMSLFLRAENAPKR
ncbi:hypothetical protein MFIFM68171_01662 [Madurella fahalii]|uniref:Zn(2)-C6 fungal-type domain-containing protein n=1 Tax=Madurella fahalii TaxID=1157608 RepID=A0ABQ0G119_9PEZI